MYGRTCADDSGVSQQPTAQQLQQQGSGCAVMDCEGGALVVDGADGPCNIDHAALATAPVYSPQPGGNKMACQVREGKGAEAPGRVGKGACAASRGQGQPGLIRVVPKSAAPPKAQTTPKCLYAM